MGRLSSKVVAERLGVKPITVLRYIRRGDIKAYCVGRSYQVEESEVEAFLQRCAGQQSNAGGGRKVTA